MFTTPSEPSGVPLAQQVMHDSGPLFVPQQPRELGDEVELRVWVPESWPLRTIALRTLVDAEMSTSVLSLDRHEERGAWWRTSIRMTNPVMLYRFCLISDDESVPSYAWLTAAGIQPWDVADSTDFRLVVHEPAPNWVDDAVVYQIFPDRFARSSRVTVDEAGRPAGEHVPDWAQPMAWDEPAAEDGTLNGTQLYGGDLDGVIEHLDHIASLGANTVYLTPIFPAGSAHRYDASTFDHVDPLLGGDDALVRLSEALHARGMRLMLDLTTNHTGVTHEWFQRAQADANAPEAKFYSFSSHPDTYRCWLGIPSLPSLEHSSRLLRERLLAGPGSIVGRYLSDPFLADGWRIDVAHMTGRNGAEDHNLEVATTIRQTMREITARTGRGTWLLAEHGHDATGDLQGNGWHGTMNYAGFTRPLWAWLSEQDSPVNWLGLPMTTPHIPGWAAAHTLRDYNAHMPWPSRLHSQNQLSSHDTPRIRTVVGNRERHLVALAAQAALPGVPTLFAGDELGLQGRNGEHARTPMPWAAIAALAEGRDCPAQTALERDIDPVILTAVRELMAVRHAHAALRRGGLQWLHMGQESMTLLRTHPDGNVLVHLARAAHEPVSIDLHLLPAAGVPDLLHVLGGAQWHSEDGQLTLQADTAGAVLLSLPARSVAADAAADTPASGDAHT